MTTQTVPETELAVLPHFDERRVAERMAEALGDVYPERRVLGIGGRWWTDTNALIRLYETPLPNYRAKVPPYWEWEAYGYDLAAQAQRFATFPQTPCEPPVWDARDEWLKPGGVHGALVTDGERAIRVNHRYAAAIRDTCAPDRWTLATTEAHATNPTALPFLCAWRGEEMVGAVMPFVEPEWAREG